jgi:hypothetical protein
MDTILQWFNNAWFVGIFGGIVSGLLVNYLSRFFLSKKENREYLQKLFSANREVIYSIRPCIPEGTVPSPATVEALIEATARKYEVRSADMYGPTEIAQELTKEVMDSSFISSQIKQDYCTKLLAIVAKPLKGTEPPQGSELTPSSEDRILAHKGMDRAANWMSAVLGVSTGLMSLVFALLTFTGKDSNVLPTLYETLNKTGVLIPLLVSLITMGLGFAALPIMKDIMKMRVNRFQDGDKNHKSGPDTSMNTSQESKK